MPDARLPALAELEKKVLWLASWTIHNANHLRDNDDGLKVGGHQASSASLATILTALYFAVLKPEDRVAVKPHAGPAFHAIQYLLDRQSREKLMNFRGYKGAQSYPSRTKDGEMVDFSTGSVGLGVEHDSQLFEAGNDFGAKLGTVLADSTGKDDHVGAAQLASGQNLPGGPYVHRLALRICLGRRRHGASKVSERQEHQHAG